MICRLFRYFSILSIFLCPLLANAQQAFKKGYVVKSTDTLYGYLQEDLESNLLHGVLFGNSASGTGATLYSVSDITAFYFENGSHFQLVKFTDTTGVTQQYFGKVLLKGYYDLYAFRNKDRQYFVVRNTDSTMLLYNDKYFTNGELNQKGNFKNILHFLANECSGLASQLDNLAYNENSLMSFIIRLNKCKAPAANSKSYYVRAPAKRRIYAYAGALPLGDKAEYAGRLIARFSLPSISKTASINTGISYMSHTSPIPGYNKKKHVIDIISAGLTIQNNFTTGIVQPYVEAGFGFAYKKENRPSLNVIATKTKYGIDVIAAAGIETFVTNNFVVKAEWRYELIAHFPTIGIAYFF